MWQDGGGTIMDLRSGRERDKNVAELKDNFEITWPTLGKVG